MAESPLLGRSMVRLVDTARDLDPVLPPPSILNRYGARILDPLTAEVMVDSPPIRNTAYVADCLLVPSEPDGLILQILDTAARDIGLRMSIDDAAESSPQMCRVARFRPGDEPVAPPDAWRVLQRARRMAADYGAEDALRHVGLDHLLFASPGVIGSPYHRPSRPRRPPGGVPAPAASPSAPAVPPAAPPSTPPVPATDPASPPGSTSSPAGPFDPETRGDSTGPLGAEQTLLDDDREPLDAEEQAISEYFQLGGGRQPVAWVGPVPTRGHPRSRRPVVAILDNGCGQHPWLSSVVTTHLSLDGTAVGIDDPLADPEISGDLQGPLDGSVDAVSGHGTFMAGLVHLGCPDADIVSARVVHTDGVVRESELVDALAQIAELVRRHTDGEAEGHPVDVLVLSMGYYHEDDLDGRYLSALASALGILGDLGVIVVAAAGNDATSRPMYPAAFAPHLDGAGTTGPPRLDRVPVLSVGASNPDGRSAALFSNSGPWVTSWEPGAALVSTMPITFHGGLMPFERIRDSTHHFRELIDPDDFSSGFAVWSGTSFAAPVLASRLAATLFDASEAGAHDLTDGGAYAAVARSWDAVSKLTRLQP